MLTPSLTQYYRPFETTRQQDEMIAEQVRDAKATVEREVEEFNLRKEEHLRRYPQNRLSVSRAERQVAEDNAEGSAAVPARARINSESTQPLRPGDKNHQDEAGDVMMEADEDVVIY